jgi:hypothetical protein
MSRGIVASLGRSVMLRSALWPDYEPPYTGLWACLVRGLPVDGENGDDLLEPSLAFSYSRQYVNIGTDWWVPRESNTLVYNASILWQQPTGPWGRIAGWALATEASGGELFAFGLADAGDVNALSTPPEMDPGTLAIQLNRTSL